MTYAWDSMIVGLMTGEIGTEMDVNASINIITQRFLRLPVGYRFVKRGTHYHIRPMDGGSHTLCGVYPLAKDEDKNIQRVSDICPTCYDALNEKDA